MSPLVSICVPVYNVAPYIERCVRSLMEQTYDKLEYIFVDDCSIDNSMEIVQSFAAQYPTRSAQVHTLKNRTHQGVAYTRRRCIEAARGEYVIWVDADDFAEPDMVDRLYTLLIQNNADVISGGNYVNFQNRQWTEQPYPEYKNFDPLSFPLRGAFCSLWGAIYKRMLFTPEMLAQEGMDYLEDRLCRLQIALSDARIVHVNDLTYHYVVHDNSITSAVSEKNMQCFVRFWQIADQLLAEHGLTDRYRDLVAYAKVQNKTSLMIHTTSMSLRKQYASLFREEEAEWMGKLKRGYWLMSHLIHYRLWGLIRIYQCYISLRFRIKIAFFREKLQ